MNEKLLIYFILALICCQQIGCRKPQPNSSLTLKGLIARAEFHANNHELYYCLKWSSEISRWLLNSFEVVNVSYLDRNSNQISCEWFNIILPTEFTRMERKSNTEKFKLTLPSGCCIIRIQLGASKLVNEIEIDAKK